LYINILTNAVSNHVAPLYLAVVGDKGAKGAESGVTFSQSSRGKLIRQHNHIGYISFKSLKGQEQGQAIREARGGVALCMPKAI